MGYGQVNVGVTSSNITLGISIAQGKLDQTGDSIDTGNTNNKNINLTGCGINEFDNDSSNGIAEGSNDNSNWNTILQTDSNNIGKFGGSGQNKTATTSYRYLRARTHCTSGGSRAIAVVTVTLTN